MTEQNNELLMAKIDLWSKAYCVALKNAFDTRNMTLSEVKTYADAAVNHLNKSLELAIFNEK